MDSLPRGGEVYTPSPWTRVILGNSWPKGHRGRDTKWWPSAGHRRWYSFCPILLRLDFRALIHLPGEKSQAATLHRSHHCRHFADCPSWGASQQRALLVMYVRTDASRWLVTPSHWVSFGSSQLKTQISRSTKTLSILSPTQIPDSQSLE